MRQARVSLFCIALTAGASQATAGAWPREEGAFFLSFGANVALFGDAVRPVHYDPTLYLEYGLTPRITVGIDGYTADAGDAGSLFAFARLPLDNGRGANRFAVSFGAGATLIPTGPIEPAARLGLHWGRGLETGWAAVDVEVVHEFGRDQTQTKIDATWGYRFDDRWTSLLGAQVGTGLEGDLYAKISPGVIWSFNERFDLRVGYVQALTGDRGGGLLMQAWVAF